MNNKALRNIALTTCSLLAAGLLLAGCDKAEQWKDAPRGTEDSTPANVMLFPDGFSNVAYKCQGPNMVYVIYHGNVLEGPKAYGAVAVIANDSQCTKGAK